MRTVGILKDGKVVNLAKTAEKPKQTARKTQTKAGKPATEKPATE